MEEITLDQLMEDPQTEAILAGANLSRRGRGKSPAPLGVCVERPLTREDIEEIGTKEVGVSAPPPISQLRDSHHEVARLMAQGFRQVDISRKTGYSQSRLSVLKNDPAFSELVESYREVVEEVFIDTNHKLKSLTDDGISIMHERLLDDPDSISDTLLLDLIKAVADRAGFAPVSKSLNLNATLDGGTLEELKNKVKGRQNGEVKTITQEAKNAEYVVIEGDCEPTDGGAVGSPRDIQEESQTEGGESKGANIRTLSGEVFKETD